MVASIILNKAITVNAFIAAVKEFAALFQDPCEDANGNLFSTYDYKQATCLAYNEFNDDDYNRFIVALLDDRKVVYFGPAQHVTAALDRLESGKYATPATTTAALIEATDMNQDALLLISRTDPEYDLYEAWQFELLRGLDQPFQTTRNINSFGFMVNAGAALTFDVAAVYTNPGDAKNIADYISINVLALLKSYMYEGLGESIPLMESMKAFANSNAARFHIEMQIADIVKIIDTTKKFSIEAP